MADPTPIPLTVLGGWLGAGKTTLLNRILTEADERIAVIVNDVGEINVDAALIAAGNDVEGIVELTNGCVCCSIAEDLELTLIELTLRTPAPDRIILEASGVADPTQIAEHAQHPRVRLDGVIALAEAAGFGDRSSRPPYGSLMRAQVAGADLVIATKLDLVDPTEHDAALAEVAAFTDASVIAARSDTAWLHDVVLGPTVEPRTRRAGVSDAGSVATHTWRPDEVVEVDRLRDTLARSGLLRAKGVVPTSVGTVTIHLAGGRVTIEPSEPDHPIAAIVLIGESEDHVTAVATELGDSVLAEEAPHG